MHVAVTNNEKGNRLSVLLLVPGDSMNNVRLEWHPCRLLETKLTEDPKLESQLVPGAVFTFNPYPEKKGEEGQTWRYDGMVWLRIS